MAWFKSWFDSCYYHLLYQHRDEEEAEFFIDQLIQFLKPLPHASMLDLACGKGRHAVHLNEKGFVVTGIDLSEQSIEHCKKFENHGLSFFVHDMRKLFRVNDFDVVFNLFTSFGYFESETENKAAIKNACFALKPGGTLVIDFLNPSYVIRNLVPKETRTIEGISFHIERYVADNFITKDIRFTDENETYHFQEKVKALQLSDFKKYLEPFGMTITDLFGDYHLNAFDMENSPRLIIIAKKPV